VTSWPADDPPPEYPPGITITAGQRYTGERGRDRGLGVAAVSASLQHAPRRTAREVCRRGPSTGDLFADDWVGGAMTRLQEQYGIPLGHSISSHVVHGWCWHCPDKTAVEEAAAWQVWATKNVPEVAEAVRLNGER
jgi:hypothetical protein